MFAGFTEWKSQVPKITVNRCFMGRRIERAVLVNIWMFGRLTAGTTQGKKRKQIEHASLYFQELNNSTCMGDAGTSQGRP